MELPRQRTPQSSTSLSTAGGDDTIVSSINNFESFRSEYEQSFVKIDNALKLDEQGRVEEARNMYLTALVLVDRALRFTLDSGHARMDKYTKMQQKLSKTKLQIESRLNNLSPTVQGAGCLDLSSTDLDCSELPPTYEEATSLSIGDEILANDVTNGESSIPSNAQEVFCLEEGVQIFFITAEGYVSAPSYPSSLKVYKFLNDTLDQQRPPSFLQIGQWYYPLVPGLSPVLQANYGGYIFPDTTAPDSGCSVGIIIPETTSPAQRDEFEQILRSVTMMHQQPPSPVESQEAIGPGVMTEMPDVRREEDATPPMHRAAGETEERMSEKISKGIITAADYISRGISYGAEKAGQLIKAGSDKVQANIKPKESTKQIPTKYQNGLETVRNASHTAVCVSSFVVRKLGDATMYLGRQVAPHIRKHGEKILPRSFSQKSASGHSMLDDVAVVAGSSLAGFGTVYTSLENGAKALARSIANETVEVVSIKYGAGAGKLAENSLYSAGNVLMTGHNVQHLGVKAVAKRAAKNAGKAVMDDYMEQNKEKPPRPDPPDMAWHKDKNRDKNV